MCYITVIIIIITYFDGLYMTCPPYILFLG